jgi:hypothetical protein
VGAAQAGGYRKGITLWIAGGALLAILITVMSLVRERQVRIAAAERRARLAQQEALLARRSTEIAVGAFKEYAGHEAVDLDAGGLFDVPSKMELWPSEEKLKWFRERGVDLLFGDDESGWGLGGVDLELVPLSRDRAESASTSDLLLALDSAAMVAPPLRQEGISIHPFGERPAFPRWYAFRTSALSIGTIECTAIKSNPAALTIRIRRFVTVQAEDSR